MFLCLSVWLKKRRHSRIGCAGITGDMLYRASLRYDVVPASIAGPQVLRLPCRISGTLVLCSWWQAETRTNENV